MALIGAILFGLAPVSQALAQSGLSCLSELRADIQRMKSGADYKYEALCKDNDMTCVFGVTQDSSGPAVVPVRDLHVKLERCFAAKMPSRMAHPKAPQNMIFINRATQPVETCTLMPVESRQTEPPRPYFWGFTAFCHLVRAP